LCGKRWSLPPGAQFIVRVPRGLEHASVQVWKQLLQVVVDPHGPTPFPLLSLQRRLRRVPVCSSSGDAGDAVQRFDILVAQEAWHALHLRGLCHGHVWEPGLFHSLHQWREGGDRSAEQGRGHGRTRAP
jgi:hypothetical protein